MRHIFTTISLLLMSLLSVGQIELYEDAVDLFDKQDYQAAVDKLDKFLEKGDSLYENTPVLHRAYDLRGRALVQTGDSARALFNFKEGIERFESRSHDEPDFLSAYMYSRAAMLERLLNDSPQKALQYVQNGIDAVATERERMKVILPRLGNEAEQRMMRGYLSVRDDLNRYRLRLQLSLMPIEEVQKHWEERVIEDTDGFLERYTLAQVYEMQDMIDSAELQYKNAAKAEPSNHNVWFSWGEMYFDAGVQLTDAIKTMQDDGKLEGLKPQVDELFEKAYIKLLDAQRVLPCHKETLRMLEVITVQLDKHEMYEEIMLQKEECSWN